MGRLLGGFAALSVATLVGQLLGFVVLAVAARRLGPDVLGGYAFALSLITYFAIPANFGVTGLAIRDVASEPDRAREIAGEALVIQTTLSLVPYAALLALTPVLAPSDVSRAVMPLVGIGFVVDAVSLWWLLFARQRYGLVAIGRLLGGIVQTVLVLAFVSEGRPGAVALAWAAFAGLMVNAVLSVAGAVRATGRPVIRLDLRRLARRFAAGVPLGFAAVMISVYYSIDSVMLGYFRDTETVGQYAVAYRLPLSLLAVAGLWVSVLLPHARRLWLEDREALRRQLGFFASLGAVLGLPLCAGAALTDGDLVKALFGGQYGSAGVPFVILVAVAAVVAVGVSHGVVVIAMGEERQYAVGVTCGAAANLALNFAVIPAFGMTGAAAATLAAEVVVFAYMARRVRARIGPVRPEWARIGRAALATAVMAGAVLVMPGGVLVDVGVGVVAFAAAAAALGVVRPAELRALRAPAPAEVAETEGELGPVV